jgi:hypothetical protein
VVITLIQRHSRGCVKLGSDAPSATTASAPSTRAFILFEFMIHLQF